MFDRRQHTPTAVSISRWRRSLPRRPLETTNGGIELRLPADAKATLAARCVNGGMSVTDLPFEKDAESSGRRVEGKINGGAVAQFGGAAP